MTAVTKTIRIGTRGSQLALVQANMVRDDLLQAHEGLDVELAIIKTSGDWSPAQGEKALPSKELYTKEIERDLLAGKIDLAVHSMKDVETFMPDGLKILHMLEREDARDCLLFSSELADKSQKITPTMRVGTVSVRRQAFLLGPYPDLRFEPLRGNVETRIEKVRKGQVDMTLLALAGLKRLGLAEEADEILEPDVMLPAAGQGAIGLQTRDGDLAMQKMLAPISCERTFSRIVAERGILEALDGSCHTPVGAYATWVGEGDTMRLRGWHAMEDGSFIKKEDQEREIKNADEAVAFGREIGREIKHLS